MQRFTRLGFAVATFVALGLPAHAAGGEQWPPAGVSYYGDPGAPDISGLWMGSTMGIPGQGPLSNSGASADGRPPSYWSPWPLPYTPAYQAIVDERAAAAKKGVQLGDTGSKCLPFGLPSMLASKHYPEEVVQTPGQVTFYFFGTFPVTVWTDGRGHPADLKPSHNGHSIGRWVGETLMVDTIGILGVTPIDSNHDPHSARLHLTWRVQRVAPDILHINLTLFDDEAFTEPVALTIISQRKSSSEWQILDDASCFDNNQDVPPPKAAEGFIKF